MKIRIASITLLLMLSSMLSQTTVSAQHLSRPDAFEQYAKGLLKKYDKDSDGFLNSKELKTMRRPPQGADTDGDGKASMSELAASARQNGKRRPEGRLNSTEKTAEKSREDLEKLILERVAEQKKKYDRRKWDMQTIGEADVYVNLRLFQVEGPDLVTLVSRLNEETSSVVLESNEVNELTEMHQVAGKFMIGESTKVSQTTPSKGSMGFTVSKTAQGKFRCVTALKILGSENDVLEIETALVAKPGGTAAMLVKQSNKAYILMADFK